MAFALTTEQNAAVTNRGGGLLVSAAAGSGKTRVLVERLLTRVAEEGRNVDEFLIITYTRAAAAELRARIADGLARRLEQAPANAHLRRQATLVYKAQISTIHAFCTVLLRECGHLLNLSPDFRLCDEGEATVIMSQVLNDLLDKRYEHIQPESDFALLLDIMSAGRDDSRLMDIALDIYSRIQSHPNPGGWLDEQEAAFRAEAVADAGQTMWGRLLLERTRRQADYWRGRIAYALELTRLDDKLSRAYADSLTATMEALAAFSAAAEKGWDEAAANAAVAFPRFGQVRGGCDVPNAQERIKAIRDKCKKRMDKTAGLFRDSSDVLLEDVKTVYPAVRGLFELVKDFARAYAQEKNRRGLLDFSDLEHGAVSLLVGQDGEPTELAHSWGGRYLEIMVDEFQDTNQVQNTIFSALSRGGRNLFLVGDVKQSIYRFRLADPTIFLHMYHTFRHYTVAREGEARCVTLSQNFRSRPQVLESVNDLFRNIMSEEFGELDYTQDQALRPGGTFPEGGGYQTELDVLDCGSVEAGETGRTDRNLLEARFVARRIRELCGGELKVSDGEGGLRPARPGDMVILLRSPGSVLHHYVRALTEQSIPWEAEGAADFFATTEVSVALSLLQVVDNPRQDVPLISVLRSPVFDFSADRLAQLRAGCDGDFYTALVNGAEEGQTDCMEFLEQLGQLRFGAGDRSSHQLIWHIYERTNLLGIFSAMPGGEERRGNLLTLYELARRFEGAGHRGLFGFLAHLGRLRDSGVNITSSGTAGEGGGVTILSIHRSKGLEFPVVFLCGLAKRFNREDMQKPMLFHSRLGVGPKGVDSRRMVEYVTLPRLAVAAQLESEMMAEELRLLYVAMTRAKEKLILTHALSRGTGELKSLREDVGAPVEPQALTACSCVGQWILLATMNRPEAEPLRQAAELYEDAVADPDDGSAWDIRLVDVSSFTKAPAIPQTVKGKNDREGQQAEALAKRLSWRYPHAELANVPSKITVTQLKGRFLDEEAAQDTQTAGRYPPAAFRRPRFAQEEFGLTAAQKGTTLHLALQYIEFDKTGTIEEIKGEIERMVRLELLTLQQGAAVDPEKLRTLFSSPLGREITAASDLRREFKFSLLVPASDYTPGIETGECQLLQGVVDCFFEAGNGLTLVDFKTDRVTEAALTDRIRFYRPQLAAYSRALEEITGRPVTRKVLWFFGLNRAIEL